MSNRVPLSVLIPRVSKEFASTKECLVELGGDYDAEKRPVFIEVENDKGETEYRQVDGYSAVVDNERDYGMSVMGDRYGLVQFRDSIKFLDELISDKKAMVRGGTLTDNRSRLHLLVQVPDLIEISPNEKYDCYYTVSTSHDGSGCLQAMCTPLHNISQTIFTPAGKGVVRIKHSANVEERLQQAKRMFNKMHTYFDEFSASIKDMVGIKLTDQQAKDYFMSVIDGDNVRCQNVRDKLYDIYSTAGLCVNLSSCRGTLFGTFMAVQQYADYYKTVRKSIRRNELDAKIEARLTGDGAKLKAESFSMALALVQQFS